MKREDLLHYIGEVDGALVRAAEKPPRRRGLLRGGLLLAAALALLGALSALAVYRWRMPEPETYEGESLKIEQEQVYERPDAEQDYVSAEGQTPEQVQTPSGLSDEDFLQRAQEVLQILQLPVDTGTLRVSHELDERWNRQQVRVSFPLDEDSSVVFDAESGYLIRVERFRWQDLSAPVMSDEEALAAAQRWYEALPYPQGYEFNYVSKIDDGAWMYDFSRRVEVQVGGETLTLPNELETVRITIDPRDGSFQLSNSFYVPLLDDHAPGDEPLSREAAIETALTVAGGADWEVSAELAICFPNYLCTATEAPLQNRRYSSVTRLAWVVTFEMDAEVWDEQMQESFTLHDAQFVYVDLYTGEILGGGALG